MAAGDLVEPVAYNPGWSVLAAALPVLVVGWYVGVTWWTRDKHADRPRRWRRTAAARREHLRRLSELETRVARGEVTPREAHLEISAVVRSFVTAVGPHDARTMSLEQLRAAGSPQVTQVVELVYPPAFQPGEQGEPVERLAPALRDARSVVAEWSP